jgi:cytochrome c-type biogenesis protein
MEALNIGQVLVTFLAGILSVLSPCIIPLLPGFIAYFAGLGLEEVKTKKHRKKMLIASLCFSLGFTFTFLAFGLVAGGLSLILIQHQIFLQQIGGLILILFGIMQSGLLKFKFVQKAYKLDLEKIGLHEHEYLRSLLIGIIFAFSWTPCYGPIIGGIFTLSASSQTLLASLLMFLVYSIGFTLPIILLSLAMDRCSGWLARHRKIFRFSGLIAGILLIVIGLLMLTNNLSVIVNWLDLIYTQNKFDFF